VDREEIPMADIALQASAVAERQIRLVKKPSHNDQHTAPAAEARATHIAWRTVGAGEPLTGVRGCLIDGYVLDALAYDAAVYLSDTDGRLSDTAGTTSVVVGRVVGAFATLLGVAADKLLDVGSLR
jgi:hypothetical protein